MKTFGVLQSLVLMACMVVATPVLANKSSVEIVAPETVAAGSEVTVTVEVFHKGNSFFHHTDYLVITVNGEEFKRFEFTAGSRPESENFQRTITLVIDGETRIEAEAHCNLHGSAGKVSAVIRTE